MKTKLALSALSLCLLSACTAMPSENAIQGTVTSVNLEGMMVDGPAIITLEATDKSTVEIHVPSMGRNLCKAKDLADVSQIKVGDTIEVNGATVEGYIVPCEAEDHFLKVLN